MVDKVCSRDRPEWVHWVLNHAKEVILMPSLVPSPSKIGGGEGLVHTVCTCALSGNYYVLTKMMHAGGPGKSYDVYI